MADRFPSLEEFDSAAQPEVQNPSVEPSTHDFLAREKALLGADADLFATDHDAAAHPEASSSDLLGDTAPTHSTFESQFPDLASPSVGVGAYSGGGSVTGPSVHYDSGYKSHVVEEDEPEVIRQWRERRDAQIERRAAQLASQREDTITEAQRNIDDFYENYNSRKEKGIAQTRAEAAKFMASREDTVSGGTSWDRITKLVDVSGKGFKGGAAGSEKDRFRELLTSLRKDEEAPGATGY